MALGMTCIPTIREEVVRLRQADILHELENGAPAHEVAARRAQKTIDAAATQRPSRRHWQSRPVHIH